MQRKIDSQVYLNLGFLSLRNKSKGMLAAKIKYYLTWSLIILSILYLPASLYSSKAIFLTKSAFGAGANVPNCKQSETKIKAGSSSGISLEQNAYENELLKFSGLNITSQRLGGISLENSYSKLLGGSPCSRLPPREKYHIVYAFEAVDTDDSGLKQVLRLKQSISTLFSKGCNGDVKCKSSLQIHVFFEGVGLQILENALGSLVLEGLSVILHLSNFEEIVTRRRKVWGRNGNEHEMIQKLSAAANYFRFYCAGYLKRNFNAESFLYLDTDTVFVGNGLTEFFQEPIPLVSFGEQKRSSCSTGSILVLENKKLKNLGIQGNSPCLAASVMLVNISLWIENNTTEILEELLSNNADEKMWHLGSMPPLMIAFHNKWTSLTHKVVDGKGSSCETLQNITFPALIIHPFKVICPELERPSPKICIFASTTDPVLSHVGSERIKLMHTQDLARLTNSKIRYNPENISSCSLVVDGPPSRFRAKLKHPKWVKFKPDNREDADVKNVPAHFVIVDNAFMDQTWQMKSMFTIPLSLVEDMGTYKDIVHSPRNKEFTQDDPAILCYHGNSMHIISMIPKLMNISIPVRLRIVIKGSEKNFVLGLVQRELQRLGMEYISIDILKYNPSSIWSDLKDCDVGLAPTEVHALLPHSELASLTAASYMQEDIQPEDRIRRCKRTANAGRSFVFFQLGIPVITDACPESIMQTSFLSHNIALVAFRYEFWSILLTRLLKDYEERVAISKRARYYAENFLTSRIQSANLLDKLSCHTWSPY